MKIKRQIRHLFLRFKKIFLLRENKIISYAALILVAFFIIFLVVFFVLKDDGSESVPEEFQDSGHLQIDAQTHPLDIKMKQITPSATSSEAFYPKPKGELSNLMQKANILYDNGQVHEALEIFNKISLYSYTLANYNLGVIYLNEDRYIDAIKLFRQAITSGDDVSLSALNASFGALKLKDTKEFNYFLNLADISLSDSSKSPFYSYLYALVSYYKGRYFETLSPLLHPNSKAYKAQSDVLASEMFLILGDDHNALQYLKKDSSDANQVALGMLYARNGEYANARNILYQYLIKNPNDLEALSALELIELRMQNYGEGANILHQLIDKKTIPFFKIKVQLAPQLFDVNHAQKNFWNRNLEYHRSLQYKILFYYAPFKVFNLQKTFQAFAEGGFESSVGNFDEAIDAYAQGEIVSRINRDITNGLKEVYTGDLRRALTIFLQNAKASFHHPVLFYNIGLVYARLGDFENAYKYFSKAYYSNNQDVISGIFAIMAGKLIYQNSERIAGMISNDLSNLDFKDENTRIFLRELFAYAQGKDFSNFRLLEKFQNPLHYAFQAVNAMNNGQHDRAKFYFSKLKEKYSSDLTTNVMYQVIKNYGGDIKNISLEFSGFFRRGSFSDMHSLYYGGSLTRELYIYLAFLTGNLSYVITHLHDKLSSEEESPVGTMQALGLAYIYNQNFEKAFAVYNDLLDNLQENDARTKFLGAVSAIGAGHHNNATALLQISKADSIATLESRYALALLYQQKENIKSTVTLLQSIANKGFVSEFFDFTIDTSEILQEAQE